MSDEAVRISVPQLVGLSRHGASLPLHAGRIHARRSGDYQSPFKGRGMEFDESRPYQPGDDVRNIDWRVTARSGRTHTKLFREERERPVFLWVDFRAPMFFATRGRYKAVMAAHMASLLGWSAVHQGDRVGSVIFSDERHHELKPQRGKAGMLRMIKQMLNVPSWQAPAQPAESGNAATHALRRLRRVARPGSLVFLLSDFRHLDEAGAAHLVRLSRHNDLVMIQIHDPLERELPPPGIYRVSDGTHEHVLDTFDRERVENYRRRFQEHEARLQQLARSHGIYLFRCETRDEPLQALRAGLVKN